MLICRAQLRNTSNALTFQFKCPANGYIFTAHRSDGPGLICRCWPDKHPWLIIKPAFTSSLS